MLNTSELDYVMPVLGGGASRGSSASRGLVPAYYGRAGTPPANTSGTDMEGLVEAERAVGIRAPMERGKMPIAGENFHSANCTVQMHCTAQSQQS